MSSRAGGTRQPRGARDRSNTGATSGAASKTAPIPVTYAHRGAAEDAQRALFGRTLSDQELASLAGALPGRGARVEVRGAGLISAYGPGGRYHLDSYLSRATPDDPHSSVVDFWFSDKKGQQLLLDARALAQQVRTAARLGGVEYITIKGRMGLPTGAPRDDVDLVQRLGFDVSMREALIQVGVGATLPSELGHPQTLSELQSTPEGMQWWLSHASGYAATYFDLRRGSRSWRMLDAYLRSHRMKGLE